MRPSAKTGSATDEATGVANGPTPTLASKKLKRDKDKATQPKSTKTAANGSTLANKKRRTRYVD